jgi:murein DD-endopeptidase MepM/ murein hydrolase activator NlpD
MAKIKYFYNPHSLGFEKVSTSVRAIVLRIFGFLSASMVAGALLLLVAYNYIDSPKEKIMRRELEQYKLQTRLLNKKIEQLGVVVNELQDRDASIYRAVFEAEPPAVNIRSANFGGIEKYAELSTMENGEAIIKLHEKLDKLSSRVYMQSKSYDELSKLAARKTDFLAAIPAIQPIANKDLKQMASGFGYRIHPIYKTYKMHTGIDFTAPTGTPIYATGNGRVELVEMGHRGYGNHVIINHGFGYQTLYGHMHKVNARQGQMIKRGELIGYVGNTGTSAAPHLHYEVIKNGNKINPINYFFNDLTEEEYAALRDLAEKPAQSFD